MSAARDGSPDREAYAAYAIWRKRRDLDDARDAVLDLANGAIDPDALADALDTLIAAARQAEKVGA
jgi:hypothetical protein